VNLLRLGSVGPLVVEACADRWRIARASQIPLPHPSEWPREWLDSSEAWQLSLQLGHLIDTGTAEADSGEISIPWERFGRLDQEGYTLPTLWTQWSPFRLSVNVDSEDWQTRFYLGGMEVSIGRVGRYVRRAAHKETFLLDDLSYELLELIDRCPRAGEHRWLDLAFLSAYTSELCATTKGWLRDNEVIFPATSGSREARDPKTRRSLALTKEGRWQHIVLDDAQMALDAPAEIRPHMTRIGIREAEFCTSWENLPVLLRPTPPTTSWYPQLTKRYRPVVTRRHIETLAAADFAVRGFETIVLPRGCWTGASIIAVSDSGVVLVRVETEECGEDALRSGVRMGADHQRIYALPYRVALASLKGCAPSIRLRAERAGIQILDRRGMLDASTIGADHIQQHELRRCRSLREAMELLLHLVEPQRVKAG